jgi:hypothetical protein
MAIKPETVTACQYLTWLHQLNLKRSAYPQHANLLIRVRWRLYDFYEAEKWLLDYIVVKADMVGA